MTNATAVFAQDADGSQLETLTIPECVTAIGTYAFAAMRKLQSITLPGTLATACGEAWFGNLFDRGASGGAPESLSAAQAAIKAKKK